MLRASPSPVAFAPYASRSPYETWVAPRRHAASFGDVTDEVLDALAEPLPAALAALRRVLGGPAHNLVLQGVPSGEEATEYFLWRLQVVPRLAVARRSGTRDRACSQSGPARAGRRGAAGRARGRW